jgi:c-di-GMP-binding flagellar brake protein YcgR
MPKQEVRNQLVQNLKEELSEEIKSGVNISEISQSIQDKAKGYVFQKIVEKMNSIKIDLN